MPLRTVLILIAVGILALFTAVNWDAFTAPTTLRLGFATIEAPLGLIMLGFTVLLGILFLVFIIYLQTNAMIEGRRLARDLQAQRQIAEQSEDSRYTQLHEFLQLEFQERRRHDESRSAEVMARLGELERGFREATAEATNTLAAYLAEIDDFLKAGRADRGGSS